MIRSPRPFRRSRGGATGRDAGASAIELAFVAPALLFFIFFAIQAGLWWYGRTVAIQAAREGVSQLRLAPDEATYTSIRNEVDGRTEAFATSVGRESLLDPQAESTYDEATGRVSMTVTGHAITLWPGPQLGITQQAFGEVERFEGDD